MATAINETLGSFMFCFLPNRLDIAANALKTFWTLKAFHFHIQRRLALIIVFTHRLTLTSVTRIIYYDVCKIKFIHGGGCWGQEQGNMPPC